MRLLASLLLAAVAVAPTAPVAAAGLDEVCVVADPTGTQLNVRRRPNDTVVGTMANGAWVLVVDRTNEAGKTWAHVRDSDPHGHRGPDLGWVFYAYLKCL